MCCDQWKFLPDFLVSEPIEICKSFCQMSWKVKLKTHYMLHLLTDEKRKRKSCKELVNPADAERKFSEKCHNRWWNLFMQLLCQNKKAIDAVSWNIVTMTKKMKHVLIGKALFITNFFHMIQWPIKRVLLGNTKVLNKYCAKNNWSIDF